MAQGNSVGKEGITLNSDIANLVRRIDRTIAELQHSQSANVTFLMQADRDRFDRKTRDINIQLDTVQSMGIPDVPESMPDEIALREPPVEMDITNDDLLSVIMQYYVLRDELTNSQSSRLGGGLIAFDYARSKALMVRIETIGSRFTLEVDPVDNPETTPDVAYVARGRRGV